MKRTIMCATILALLITGGFVTSVQSQNFQCGSDLLTYDVQLVSPSTTHPPDHTAVAVEGTAPGVRCVRYYPQGAVAFVWYGEGSWGQRTYRHVGIAYRGGSDVGVQGKAGDFSGEGFSNSVVNLSFQLVDSQNPSTITVKPWNEQWTLRVHGLNYKPLPRPTTCGPNFVEYHVDSTAQTGQGLRCVLRLVPAEQNPEHEGVPSYATAWFGNGNWRGTTYSHIGRVKIDRFTADAGTGEASDICDVHFGQFCGTAPQDSIRFTYQQCRIPGSPPAAFKFTGYQVGGAWNEHWGVPNLQGCTL